VVVIKIENLWKEYRLGVIGHGTLVNDLQSWWAKVRGKEDPNSKIPMLKGQEKQIEGDRFWALRDINLEVKKGEVLGIIGNNGAGKSTLLKILSRVTAPSKGIVKVKGRISSLLEVGTGFHPELTGRENIFMNGAILGMYKKEIKNKLDEIIDFSGIENFIDTPVKRYSSGMYVRLAFAVAAHLEPEILVIDEVLAVGDAEFQKKCLGKMGEISRGGRTVLFVSHNMGAVNLLCRRCIGLDSGTIFSQGPSSEIISQYLNHSANPGVSEKVWSSDNAPGSGSEVQLLAARICQPKNKSAEHVEINRPFYIELVVSVAVMIPEFAVGVRIARSDGIIVIHSNHIVTKGIIGKVIFTYELPSYVLNTGNYHIRIISDVPNKKMLFEINNCLCFSIISTSKRMGKYKVGTYKGIVGPFIGKWTLS